LTIFADAMAKANTHGRDAWVVVRAWRKVRLVVGHVIVYPLVDGHDWMGLEKVAKVLLERERLDAIQYREVMKVAGLDWTHSTGAADLRPRLEG
jgi:hypothetical protein